MKLGAGSKLVNEAKAGIGLKASVDVVHKNDPKASKMPLESQEVKDGIRDVQDGLSASVRVLPLPAGLYLFSVKAAAPTSSHSGPLALPAMHVGLGPGVRSEQVEFIAGPSTHGAWLFSAGDLLVTKICGGGVTLILTSVRAPRGEVLSISVERLDKRAEINLPTPSPEMAPATTPDPGAANGTQLSDRSVFKANDARLPLPVEIGAHIRTRGDMTFANAPWAGRVGPGLWIESFTVRPMEIFGARDIEYKGLTGSGFETPWISEGKMCGTKGISTPLVGFAIRLKPSPPAAGFDCEYSGYFQSGKIIGPLRNGAPCRSSVASDSLEGIQVRIIKRVNVESPEVAAKADDSPKKALLKSNRTLNGAPPSARREPTRRP